MDFLLQSEDTVLWGSSDEGKRIRIAAQQQIYEAVYLAAVTGQGKALPWYDDTITIRYIDTMNEWYIVHTN